MLGTLVNVAAVIVLGCIGLIFKRAISEKCSDLLMKGIGLCVIYIGISGAINAGADIAPSDTNSLITIIAMTIGGIIGHALKLEYRMNRLGERVQERFAKGDSRSTVAEGFVTASLIYCVGAMAIVGSLQSGLNGDHDTLFIKSLLDGIMSIILAAQLGFGVLLSAIPVLIYQGAITLCAQWVEPFLNPLVIAEMNCIGYILIIAIGLNIAKITKFKVMNYVPGVIIAGIMAYIINKIPDVYNFLYAA
ncbi:MAG: DUF554 domain-containing protein [Ruminococcaceae bacterium]|nr:DUF554 domain-containing protein [Oscillospiraceae bacterium]